MKERKSARTRTGFSTLLSFLFDRSFKARSLFCRRERVSEPSLGPFNDIRSSELMVRFSKFKGSCKSGGRVRRGNGQKVLVNSFTDIYPSEPFASIVACLASLEGLGSNLENILGKTNSEEGSERWPLTGVCPIQMAATGGRPSRIVAFASAAAFLPFIGILLRRSALPQTSAVRVCPSPRLSRDPEFPTFGGEQS